MRDDHDQGSDTQQGSKTNTNPEEGANRSKSYLITPTMNIAGQVVTIGQNAMEIAGPTLTPEPLMTNVTGHPITAAPDAIGITGTTVHPGEPGMKLDGTDRHLVVGSRTIAFAMRVKVSVN